MRKEARSRRKWSWSCFIYTKRAGIYNIFLLHCTSPLLDCKHLTVLLRSKLLIQGDNLPFFLLAFATPLKHLSGVIHLFRSPPATQQYFLQASHRTCVWMKWIVPQWRWLWHLGRQVWWCRARKGGLFGISSSKPHRDTESSWSRWALLRCTFLPCCHGWSTEITCPTQHVYFNV